jgi:hypothetical protein
MWVEYLLYVYIAVIALAPGYGKREISWTNITLPSLPSSLVPAGNVSVPDAWMKIVADVSGIFLVAASRRFIYYSIDQGQSWNQSEGFDPLTMIWADVAISLDGEIVFAAASFDSIGYSSIYASFDHGEYFYLDWRTGVNTTRYHQIFSLDALVYIYGMSIYSQSTFAGSIVARHSIHIQNATTLWTPAFGGYRTIAVSGDGSVVYYSTYILPAYRTSSSGDEGYIFMYGNDHMDLLFVYKASYAPNIMVCSGDGQHVIGAHSASGYVMISDNFGERDSWTEKQFAGYNWRALANDRSGLLLYAIVSDRNEQNSVKLLSTSNYGFSWTQLILPFLEPNMMSNSLLSISYTGKFLYLIPNVSSNVVVLGTSYSCPFGHELNIAGKCEACAVGMYLGINDTTCQPCAPGSYNNRQGSADCWGCPLGYYAPSYNMTLCLACPVGTATTTMTNAVSCSVCSIGTYSNAAASYSCKACPVGRYGVSEGKNLAIGCLWCPANTYSPLQGQLSCLPEFDFFQNTSIPKFQWVNYTAGYDLTWTRMAIDDTGLNLAAINSTHILYSTNGGLQWNALKEGLYTWYDIVYDNSNAVYVSFKSEELSMTGIKKSTTHGEQFYIYAYWSHLDMDIHQIVPIYRSEEFYVLHTSYHYSNGTHISWLRRFGGDEFETSVLESYENETFLAAAISEENNVGFVTSVFHSITVFSGSNLVANPGTGIIWTVNTKVGSGTGQTVSTPHDQIVCSFDGRQAVAVVTGTSELRYNANYGSYGNWVFVQTSFAWQSMVMDRSGNLVMAVVRDRADGNVTKLVASYDGGVTWTNANRPQYTISLGTIMHWSSSSNSLVLLSSDNQNVMVGRTSECAPGSRLVDNGSNGITCELCRSGTASTEWNASTCTICLSGSYSAQNGSASCIKCPAGYYSMFNGSTSCSPCPYGTRSELTIGSSSCRNCTKGFYSDTVGNKVCTRCPTGRYGAVEGGNMTIGCPMCRAGTYTASTGELKCLACATGTYQSESGQNQCAACPLNYYVEIIGATVCQQCPSGRLTNAVGQKTASACFSPYPNIVAGLLSAILSFFVAFIYIYNGEVNHLADERESTLVTHLSNLCDSINEHIESIISNHQVDREAQRRRDHEVGVLSETRWKRLLNGLLFFLFAPLLLVIVSFSTYVRYVTHMLFMSMIVFRGVKVSIPFEQVVNKTVRRLFLQREWLLVFYRPFLWVLDLVSMVRLNFQNVNVTCAGIQGPIQLLFNCIALIATVFVIAAKYQYFWSQYLCPLPGAVTRMFFIARNYRGMKLSGFLRLLWVNGTLWALCMLNPFQQGLMYLMSLTTLYLFIEQRGLHDNTPGCDSQPGVRNIDRSLAILSSILAYLFLQPALYTISVVLVPYLPPWCTLGKKIDPNAIANGTSSQKQSEQKPTGEMSSSSLSPSAAPTSAKTPTESILQEQQTARGAAKLLHLFVQSFWGRTAHRVYHKLSTYLSLDLIMLEISRSIVRRLRLVLENSMIDSSIENAAVESTEEKCDKSNEVNADAVSQSSKDEAPQQSPENEGLLTKKKTSSEIAREVALGDSPGSVAVNTSTNAVDVEAACLAQDNEEGFELMTSNKDNADVAQQTQLASVASAVIDADNASVWAMLLASSTSLNTYSGHSNSIHPTEGILANSDGTVANTTNNNKSKHANKPRVLPTFAELSEVTYAELCWLFFDIEFPTEPGKLAFWRQKGGGGGNLNTTGENAIASSPDKIITVYIFIWLFLGSIYFMIGAMVVFLLVASLGYLMFASMVCSGTRSERTEWYTIYVFPSLWLYLIIYPVYGIGTFILYLLSFTILGHLSTRYGRQCWWIILYNYWVFSCVSLGIWIDDFALVMGVRSADELQPLALSQSSAWISLCCRWCYGCCCRRNKSSDCCSCCCVGPSATTKVAVVAESLAEKDFTKIEIRCGSSEQQQDRHPRSTLEKNKDSSTEPDEVTEYDTDALSALIGIRAVLFQLSQTLAPVSVLVASGCSTPLFVFSDEIRVPPMLATNAWSQAVAEVASETGFRWTIPFIVLRNFVMNSRLIQFVLNACPAVMATLLILLGRQTSAQYVDILSLIAAAYMALTIAVSVVQSLELVVYLGRFLDITDDYFVWSCK